MKGLTQKAFVTFLFGALCLWQPSAAKAAKRNLETWMQGKDLRIIVTFRAGGGHDLTARIIARTGAKYFPGKPRITVKNLPGGGGLRGLRYTYKQKPDGLTAGQLHPQFLLRPLIGLKLEGFDPTKIRLVGNLRAGPPQQMLCIRRSVATSWKEVLALKRTITFGDTSYGSSGGAGALFLQFVGAPVKVVTGYGGTSGIIAALDRGELDSGRACQFGKRDTVARRQPQWLKKPTYLVPIAYYGDPPDAARLRELGLKMPPLIFDLPGVKHTKVQRRALALAVELTAIGNRSMWLPPEVPDDMFKAWDKMVKSLKTDAKFMELSDAAGQPVNYISGSQLDAFLGRVKALPPAGISLLNRLNTGK
jgi:tripartite-type tricarboxylate transporter receptor subunit TctC